MARTRPLAAFTFPVLPLLLVSCTRATCAPQQAERVRFSPAAKHQLVRATRTAQAQRLVSDKQADVVATVYIAEPPITDSSSPASDPGNSPDHTVDVVKALPGFRRQVLFGALGVSDIRCFVRPDAKSRVLGALRFSYAFVSTTGASVQLTGALEFTGSVHFSNGSVIVFTGHDYLSAAGEEYPIVGGTGFFRLARGYLRVTQLPRRETATDKLFKELEFVVFLTDLSKT